MEVLKKIGRRKTAVARITLEAGKGEIFVNGRKIENYFNTDILQLVVSQPLTLLNENGKFDIKVNVKGGGISGQAEAVRLAISRALCDVSGENRSPLKKEGYLTRDPRMVERKKFGRRKARRSFQFSKR